MTDYMGYYDWFYEVPTLYDSHLSSLFGSIGDNAPREPGFMLYTCIVKTIVPNYFFWVFVNALITVLVLDWFFNRYSRYYALSYVIFLAFLGLGLEINTYRNVKSIALFLLSIPYIEQRKPWKYMALNILGIMFHISSVLYLPLYFILNRRLSTIWIWILFVTSNLIFLLHIPFIRPALNTIATLAGGRIAHLVQVYTSLSFDTSYGLSIGFFERNLTFILIALMYKRLTASDRHNVIFCNLFFLYFVTFFCLSEIKIITDRIPMLFICSYWVLYPAILQNLKYFANRLIILTFIIVLCLLKIATGTNNILCHYDNLLLGTIESFETRTKIYYQVGITVVK